MLREAPRCPACGVTNPLLLTSLIALVCIRAGALIGMFVRMRKDIATRIPGCRETKDGID